MRTPAHRKVTPASLQGRVLLLTLLVFIALSVPAYFVFHHLIDKATIRLGALFAEKQVQFDRYRALETLSRETSLAGTLARSPVVLEWARDEDDPDKRRRGLAELEHYRRSFTDRSYFIVINQSRHYYFNDRDNSFAGKELRYTLERGLPRDDWYFQTVAAGRNCRLNVNRDEAVEVTKVWINCPLVDGADTVGLIGTGIDLDKFIRKVVDIPQTGVDSMFIDRSGAIQAYRDPELIDFHSLTKDAGSKKTIFQLIDNDADRVALVGMMTDLAEGAASVRSRFITIEGRKYLVGVGYLDDLDWFNLSLMDTREVIDPGLFMPMGLLIGIILLLAALLLTVLFKRIVLDRLARLEASVRKIQLGDYAIAPPDTGNDEIGRLSRAFSGMTKVVAENTQLLEERVRERTMKLERLAEVDPLTEIYNRRGFMNAAERERNRAGRSRTTLGLLLVDLDLLKSVNDTYGHQAGDVVLVEVSRRLKQALRNYDICARWGGDEFAVLISECDEQTLRLIAAKILDAVSGEPIIVEESNQVRVTVSVGASLVGPDETIDVIAAKADQSLYEAKAAGRNHIIVHDRTPAQGAPLIDLP